jgi:hypothetical protein
MNNNSSSILLKDIKIKNFDIHISELEKIKSKSEICKIAIDKYKLINLDDLEIKKEWLMEFLDLGILFINFFDLANYFKNEDDVNHSDLLLLDKSIYGFEIKVPRADFENEIKFKLVFDNLFFEEKLLPIVYNKLFDFKSDVPF